MARGRGPYLSSFLLIGQVCFGSPAARFALQDVTYSLSGRSLLDKFGQVTIEELPSEGTLVVVLRSSGAPILVGLSLPWSSSRAIASTDYFASWKPATRAELTYFHWT
jgi:hypothetical protein